MTDTTAIIVTPPPFLENLVSGWSMTIKKHSFQISAINTAWQTLALAGVIPLDPLILAFITLGLTGLTGVAANLTQTAVASFDPTKFKLVPIDGQ